MILKIPILSKTQRKYWIFFKHFNYSKLFSNKTHPGAVFCAAAPPPGRAAGPWMRTTFLQNKCCLTRTRKSGSLVWAICMTLPVFRILTLILELSSFIPSSASLMRESVDLSEVGGGNVKPFIHHSCTSRHIFISILTPEKAYLVRCVWL